MSTRREALAHLKRTDSRLYTATRAHHRHLPLILPAKRTRTELFSALVSIVVSQQLGTAAADSIFARVQKACKGKITPDAIMKMSEVQLRAAGLSRAKVKTIKALAESVKGGSLDLLSLKRTPEDETATRLTSIWGLGPWSVEMFMMFALGRADVFSPGDLGLVRSIEQIYGLPKDTDRTRPNDWRRPVGRASLLTYSEKWSPYRTWACLLLWRLRDNGSDRAQSEEVLRRARRRALPAAKGRHR